MADNYANNLEAIEEEWKQNVSEPQQKTDSEPQQAEENPVEGKLKEFFKGLKPIDFFMLKNAPDAGIKFIGEEYTTVKGKDVNKNDYITYSALAVSMLAEKRNLFIRTIDGDLYLFTGTHYEPIDADVLRKWLLLCMDAIGAPYSTMHYTPNTDSYIKGFRDNCLLMTNWKGKASKRAINVKNGIISFDEKGNAVLTPHTHELPYRYSLNYEYNPNATAPTFDRFLSEVLPDEQARKQLQTYIGSIFTDIHPQKVVFLFGDGANGKSVFTHVIEALLDINNVEHRKLSELCDNAKGESARMAIKGKLLNVSEEAGREFDSDTFKSMAVGEAISGRLLYKNPITFKDYARLMFSCNHFPRTEDRSNGFYRRIAIIKFPKTFTEKEQDPELESKIVENELSGVLNWVIEGVQFYIKNGYKLPRCEEGERLLEELKLQSDNVLLFLNDREIEAGNEPVTFRDFFNEYVKFAQEGMYKVASERTFSQRLANAGIVVKKAGHAKTTYAYINKPL